MRSLNEDAYEVELTGKHIPYDLSVNLRKAIENEDYTQVRRYLCRCYSYLYNEYRDVYPKDNFEADVESIVKLTTDINKFDSGNINADTIGNVDTDAQDRLNDEWNDELTSFFDLCTALGIYVCKEGDKYSTEEDIDDEQTLEV